MTKPRKAAAKAYPRNVPYTSISVTLDARDAARESAAVLSGITGVRASLSGTLHMLRELLRHPEVVELAKRIHRDAVNEAARG